MNKNWCDDGFNERLKLNAEAVPTLKGHESEPQDVCETVSNIGCWL